MKTVKIKAKVHTKESRIVVRNSVLGRVLPELLQGREALVFTDENVLSVYKRKIAALKLPVYAMPAGEEHKTPETLFALLKKMADSGLHRNSVLVALGGGVVGDIGGLAAALYMRGIECVQVPTTLLAQVDSSVGGKTAVDFCGVKNLIGAFKQPETVLVDGAFLKTLPAREIRCGLGEIVKHAALNVELFDLLVQNMDKLTDLKFLTSIVPKNIQIKADIVRLDPDEKGLRKCLNLGHTTAHAFELHDGKLSHGEYVLIGTMFEAELARRHHVCDIVYLDALEALCRAALGGVIPSLPDAGEAATFARLDKKNTAKDTVVITAPVRKGEYALLELPYAQYEAELKEIKERLC